jgi:G-patch domain/FHA domain
MEDGEIYYGNDIPEEDTGTASEWPGRHSRSDSSTRFPDTPDVEIALPPKGKSGVAIRFLVLKTAILSKRLKVAILDGYSTLEFGRDIAQPGSDIPRIRLKEMEVSKVHATVYWDVEMNEWAVVDMGSKHGTYYKPPGFSPLDGREKEGVRLSPPRVASIPRKLRHGDHLTIGTTTFQIHIHDGELPCVACSPGVGEEIPLFPPESVLVDSSTLKRSREVTEKDASAANNRDPKKALSMLKRSLLTRHDDSARPKVDRDGGAYVDRSARRRALYPESRTLPSSFLTTSKSNLRSPHPETHNHLANLRPVDMSLPPAPPAPLSSTNIGHRLLMKQGWKPGTSLGTPDSFTDTEGRVGLVVPIEISSNINRAGLGAPKERLSAPRDGAHSSSWKDIAKRKRWEDFQSDFDERK